MSTQFRRRGKKLSKLKAPYVYSTNPDAVKRREQRMVKKSRPAASVAQTASMLVFEQEAVLNTPAKEEGGYEIKVNEDEVEQREDGTLVGDDNDESEESDKEVKKDLVSGSANDVADYIMKQPRAFTVELLQYLKEYNGIPWRLVEETREEAVHNNSVESEETDFELDECNDTPSFIDSREEYTANKEPTLDIKPGEPNEASIIMNVLHDTLTYHQGARIHSEKVAIGKSEDIQEERRKKEGRSWMEWNNGRPQVKRQLEGTVVYGFRGYFGMRRAFDYVLTKLDGPKVMWKNSDQWFRASMDIIDWHPGYALLVFEPDTHTFLTAFKQVIELAEKDALEKWMQKKTDEEYADLMGQERSMVYRDSFRPIPVLN